MTVGRVEIMMDKGCPNKFLQPTIGGSRRRLKNTLGRHLLTPMPT